MNDVWKRPLFALAALSVAGGALWYISSGDLGENLVYYWSPTELMEKDAAGATVRLGGLVQPGTLEWDREAQTARFVVSDGRTQVPVNCKGNPPQMFREGIGVVVEGELGTDGVFTTERVMVKHSNEYQAPEDGSTPDPKLNTVLDES